MAKSPVESDLLNNLCGKNILFVSHAYITIFSDLFADFTSSKCNAYTIIRHSLLPTKKSQSKLLFYRKKQLKKQNIVPGINGPYAINFLKDFFLTIFWVMKGRINYDIAFGTNNLNVLSLLVLKKLGRVKKVIFISIDYTPDRYDSLIFNAIYHWFDRICCYNTDIIWNSSKRTNKARIKNGVDPKKIVHTIVMPDGSNFNSEKRLPIGRINRKKLIFLGGMRPVMGIELILESFKNVLKKVPGATLLLIGGGSHLEKYKELSSKLGLAKYVNFTGFIESHDDVDDLFCTGAVGLAPFAPDKSSYEYYSDVGKPKAYLAAGMPVIITRVPEIADEIEKKGAGIVINYSEKELTRAMLILLRDEKIYGEFRKNAIKMSEKYIWLNIFNDVYKKTFEQFKS